MQQAKNNRDRATREKTMGHYGALFMCRVFATSASISLVRDPQTIGFLEVKIGWTSEKQSKKQAALHVSKKRKKKDKSRSLSLYPADGKKSLLARSFLNNAPFNTKGKEQQHLKGPLKEAALTDITARLPTREILILS